MGEFVSMAVEDGVATIRIDRPPVNALNTRFFEELGDVVTACGEEHVRAVVLWGGPKVFAAGADIKEMADADFRSMELKGQLFQDNIRALERLPKVVIAAINGYALGGGLEVTLAADFRFAAEDAKLGLPEIQLGIIPGGGATQRLPRLVGITRAKQLIYSGDMVTAQDALAMGLVDRVVAPDEVYEEALTAARRYARGPYAVRMAKRAIDEGAYLDLDAGLRLESSLFAAVFASDDARTGMASFVERGPGKADFSYR